MPVVMNRLLYERLRRAFGPVKISNAGQAMVATDGNDVYAEIGRPVHLLTIHQPGEYYLTNCPYCHDTRFRLYVSHMFGKKTDAGRPMNFLAICYNESCLRRPENWEDFKDRLNVTDEMLDEVRIPKGTVVPLHLRVAEWPGACKRLDRLEENHKACLYVRSRRFDPERLGRTYGVSYCSESLYPLARGRLVIPVFWEGKLIGWQTRYLGELAWKNAAKKPFLPPKYWTMPGMPRGSILANIENARLFRTGVLVEGWFDVFGFGPMAMPVLGNTVTVKQRSLFATVFNKPGRSGVLLLDPEEFDKRTTQRVIGQLREKFSGPTFAAVKLPKGTDPGKLDRQFLRDYVREEAADQGVEVSWDRIDGG